MTFSKSTQILAIQWPSILDHCAKTHLAPNHCAGTSFGLIGPSDNPLGESGIPARYRGGWTDTRGAPDFFVEGVGGLCCVVERLEPYRDFSLEQDTDLHMK